MLSHNHIEKIKQQAFLGYPSNLYNICQVRPITMGEILLPDSLYGAALDTLLLTEVDICKLIKEKTGKEPKIAEIKPLHYLLDSAEKDNSFLLELQKFFSTFITEDILLLPDYKAVVVGSPKEKRLITNENFSDFQDILRIQNVKKIKEPPPENESAIAREFRLKAEYRDSIKKKQQEKNGEVIEISELLEIATVYGIDCKNTTIYAFYKLLTRYRAREKWQQDIQMLCAGADSTKIKTNYWAGSLKEK